MLTNNMQHYYYYSQQLLYNSYNHFFNFDIIFFYTNMKNIAIANNLKVLLIGQLINFGRNFKIQENRKVGERGPPHFSIPFYQVI
jgi:hypothetical protein